MAAAYIPQIAHLVREHCAVGISLRAWSLWVAAGFLLMPSALTGRAAVFTVLLIAQIILGIFILVFSYYHKGKGGTCPIHGNTWL